MQTVGSWFLNAFSFGKAKYWWLHVYLSHFENSLLVYEAKNLGTTDLGNFIIKLQSQENYQPESQQRFSKKITQEEFCSLQTKNIKYYYT